MKLDTFDSLWSVIIGNLTPRPELYRWGALRNVSGHFAVTAVTEEAITIRPGTGKDRRISRSEFEKLASSWPDYRDRKIRRKMLKANWNTSYIFSIFHWAELQSTGKEIRRT